MLCINHSFQSGCTGVATGMTTFSFRRTLSAQALRCLGRAGGGDRVFRGEAGRIRHKTPEPNLTMPTKRCGRGDLLVSKNVSWDVIQAPKAIKRRWASARPNHYQPLVNETVITIQPGNHEYAQRAWSSC